jgi:hypothetical protein
MLVPDEGGFIRFNERDVLPGPQREGLLPRVARGSTS